MVMIGIVLMLLLLVKMVVMMVLLMMLALPRAPVRSFISRPPVQPRIPAETRSHGAAVTPSPVNGPRGPGVFRVKGARGHREALMLLHGMVGVMHMVVMVPGARHRISAAPRSVTDGVFHKGVHVVR